MTHIYTHAPARRRLNGHIGLRIDTLVGDTPLLRFPRLAAHLPKPVELYAKAEWFNPGGSVKDRPALNIIRQAQRRGDLRPGITLLDGTSGNMGIAYAMLGRALGYGVKLTMPANVSQERLQILRAYGAEIVLTDPDEGTDGAIRRVQELYKADPERYFWADQFNNDDNWRAHYQTTGPEIWQQTQGRVTHFVAGLGTSGTMMGTGRYLREQNPEIRLVGVQPEGPKTGISGLKHMASAIVPGIYDPDVHNETIAIGAEEAYAMCRRLARDEGVLVGVSAGAALAAALHVAGSLEEGVVVTLLPDSAAKYLSEPFWHEE